MATTTPEQSTGRPRLQTRYREEIILSLIHI